MQEKLRWLGQGPSMTGARIDESGHDKTGLQIFVLVIPKGGLADTSAAEPIFLLV